MKEEKTIHQNILDNMSDGVMTIDRDGRIITFNGAAESILGLPADSVLNKLFGEVFLTMERNDIFNQTILDSVYESAMLHNKKVIYAAYGKEILLNVTTSFLKPGITEKEEHTAVIVVFQDITEIERLSEAEKKLAEELKGKHKELQNAYINLEEANRNLDLALKKMHKIRIIATGFIIMLFVIIGLFTWKKAAPTTADAPKNIQIESKDLSKVKTYTVEKKPISDSIALKGFLKPINMVNITSPFNGKVKETLFQYGQYVEKGQLLLKMDASETESKHREAQVAFMKAREKMSEVDKWQSGNEVTAKKRSLSKSKMTLDTAKNKFEQSDLLYKKGYISKSDYEGDKQSFENAKLDFETAQEELATTIKKGEGYNWKAAKLELENARYKLQELDGQLKRAVVYAPVSGTVILPDISSDKEKKGKIVENGISFSEGEIILSIGNTEGLSVTADVDEMEVIKIQKGQEVTVTEDAFPGIILKGVVSSVSTQASKSSGGKKTPSFEINVAIDKGGSGAKDRLRLGMSAKAEIVIMKKPDAIMVPIGSIFVEKANKFVMVKDKNTKKFKKTMVETGITTLDKVEILKGLNVGDEIALP